MPYRGTARANAFPRFSATTLLSALLCLAPKAYMSSCTSKQISSVSHGIHAVGGSVSQLKYREKARFHNTLNYRDLSFKMREATVKSSRRSLAPQRMGVTLRTWLRNCFSMVLPWKESNCEPEKQVRTLCTGRKMADLMLHNVARTGRISRLIWLVNLSCRNLQREPAGKW